MRLVRQLLVFLAIACAGIPAVLGQSSAPAELPRSLSGSWQLGPHAQDFEVRLEPQQGGGPFNAGVKIWFPGCRITGRFLPATGTYSDGVLVLNTMIEQPYGATVLTMRWKPEAARFEGVIRANIPEVAQAHLVPRR
jgi:hypothetical protein